jgi:oligopeptidase A
LALTPLFLNVVIDLESNLVKVKKARESLEKMAELNKSKGTDKTDYTYSGVVERLEEIQAPLSYSWGVVNHLMGVKNSEDLRKAHDEMQPKIVQTYQTIGQSLPVYQALSSLRTSPNVWQSLDEAQKRIVDSAIRDMKSSGVALSDGEREEFNKLQLELAELSTRFSNNVLDSTKKFTLLLTKPEEIDGLPQSAKSLLAQTAVNKGHAGATAEAGPWMVTLDMPSYLPCMQHLKDRNIREQLYRAYVTRASSDDHDNTAIIQRILQLKTQMAKILGYNCHAEKSLSSKMASSVEQVMQLIEMLREKSFPAAQRELQAVRDYAKAQGCSTELDLWDISYWSERLRENMYEYEEEQLRPYFSLPTVLDGLFALAKRLFGVVIVPANSEAQLWNDEVMFFKVIDEQTNEHIASFYLDAYSRPSEKRGGAWMDVCVGRSKVLKRIPVAYLTCNGSPPVGDKPSLMTFREVETLFHEFGHGLQHMLTKVEHGDAAGSKFYNTIDIFDIHLY